ncbi:MAG: hypothetical protein ACR2JD_04425 [Nocardioides sp.]
MTASPPAPLVVAASLVAVEGLLLVLYGLLEAASISSGRVTMGVTTAGFFLVYGGGLLVCGWALWRRSSWARGPVVFAQLLQLGIAWNLRGGDTTVVAIGLAAVALVVLVGLLHPTSTDVLRDGAEPA